MSSEEKIFTEIAKNFMDDYLETMNEQELLAWFNYEPLSNDDINIFTERMIMLGKFEIIELFKKKI